MTPEQVARVVNAGKSAFAEGSPMYAAFDAMHAELMTIADEGPTIVMPAGEKIIAGQRLRLSSDGKAVFVADAVAPLFADAVAPLFGIAVTDADKGVPVVVREITPPEQILKLDREVAGITELKTPATDAGQPPEPGPYNRTGPAHPDNQPVAAEEIQQWDEWDDEEPDVSGGGVPYPGTALFREAMERDRKLESLSIAPWRRDEPVPPNEDFVAAGEPGHEQYVYAEDIGYPVDADAPSDAVALETLEAVRRISRISKAAAAGGDVTVYSETGPDHVCQQILPYHAFSAVPGEHFCTRCGRSRYNDVHAQ
jgi:hypothetical protein